MKLRFTKMQGAGNDFVVLDGVSRTVELTPERARRIADRHYGVGCDQVLLVEPARGAGADFRYRIWNADGGEVEQCGNGARCFVRFVRDKGLTKKSEIRVETLSGIIAPRLEADGQVSVDMGAPQSDPERVPFDAGGLEPLRSGLRWPLEVEGRRIEVAVLSMGNPHAVQTVEDVDAAPVTTQGPAIERHPRFPKRTNAGYLQILDRSSVRLRVWERGAGETLACGTGACAAVVAGIREGLLEDSVLVATRGGQLTIRWAGGENEPSRSVWMTGPAAIVFEGEIEIES
ncbi:MAG TPA: diaminopimelate epimerase [Burkholderiales bacterium]|nr:diaminopimelate epimerase [Burkholderiales bacterium]